MMVLEEKRKEGNAMSIILNVLKCKDKETVP